MKIPLLLLIGVLSANATTLTVTGPNGTVDANYSTSHVFVDEIAGDSVPITFFLDTQTNAPAVVEAAEILTNLNRRDRATLDANTDQIEDGIVPPNADLIPAGNDNNYYKAYTMTPVSGGYTITLNATKTGAYRATGRYRLTGEQANTYHYFNSETTSPNVFKRDHAIVVSPTEARDVRLYEVNTLNIEASGTQFNQRSTFEDLSDRPGAIHTNPLRANNWNLDYVKNLGINWLWFQPFHPYGIEGRHLSAKNINDRQPPPPGDPGATTWLWNGGSTSEDVNFPYELGSPYAVKNFWEIEPRMSATFNAGNSTQLNRDNAMIAFQNFVADADTAGVNIMPDAAFNHTAWDVELGEPGIATASGNPNISWMAAQGASGWLKTDLIHDRELRVFTRLGDYRLRANFYSNFFNNNIAPAPDRTDFGKFLDVCEVFFGRYAALVGAQDGSEVNNYNSEGDWIDYTPSDWNGSSGGSFDAFTRASWRYFAQYAPYWLGKTRLAGQNRNSLPSDGNAATRRAWDARGIDGLRCDFGQGLPPQSWEYIINVARSYKWNFVFMAETLDNGAPAYRSNRQFDILNETSFRDLRNASNAQSYRTLFNDKRNAFGQGLVLLNTVSHDEDTFQNPWDGVVRYAVSSSQDGVPMIFPGQELGISTQYGYDLMEKNFGKYIPHFKTYNSMMPIWSNTDFGNDQLYPVYSAIGQARKFSTALRSSNRYFLYRTGAGGDDNNIFAVAKYQTANASPATSDVVFGFVNLDRNNDHAATYVADIGTPNLFGIKAGRQYNTKNIAAYTAIRSNRRDIWQWRVAPYGESDAPQPRTGSDILANGIYVGLKKVPITDGDWSPAPYESQYLKLYDVTAPTTTPGTPSGPNPYAYSIGNSVTFTWPAVAADSEGVVPSYRVNVIVNGNTAGSFVTANTSYTFSGNIGDYVTITVQAVNPSDTGNAGPTSLASESIKTLDATADEDGDGTSNAAEQTAGTNPLNNASVFRIESIASVSTNYTVTWSSVIGKNYLVESSPDLTSTFTALSGTIPASNTPPGTSTSYIDTNVTGSKKFYRVKIVP